ncbi:hypothetical protein GCM10010218_30390 [Streptomyces mashuensis]|uniref:Uncharacterized protein n=1 Tax=Streptomyces mashuensis TaxID=33904 RepID=A0A919B3G9_9ACTN|nr:hypothetical protein [Streptomyces mashuensis]GHF47023.1 hypothetical protein GCM10010218_30390 [Streptomyces mashuensis]
MGLLRAWGTYERRAWTSLGLWLARRRDGVNTGAGAGAGAGVRELGYAKAQASTMYGLLFVCVVETVGLAFFTAGYPAVHWPMLAVDVYTVLLVLGAHASAVTRPHTVGPDGLRLRQGASLDIRIPAGLIRTVRRELRSRGGEPGDGELDLAVAAQTTVTVELSEPVTVVRLTGREQRVHTLRWHADDPAAAVAAVKALTETRKEIPGAPAA